MARRHDRHGDHGRGFFVCAKNSFDTCRVTRLIFGPVRSSYPEARPGANDTPSAPSSRVERLGDPEPERRPVATGAAFTVLE